MVAHAPNPNKHKAMGSIPIISSNWSWCLTWCLSRWGQKDQRFKVTVGEFEGSLEYMWLYLNQLINEQTRLPERLRPYHPLTTSSLCSDGDKAACTWLPYNMEDKIQHHTPGLWRVWQQCDTQWEASGWKGGKSVQIFSYECKRGVIFCTCSRGLMQKAAEIRDRNGLLLKLHWLWGSSP